MTANGKKTQAQAIVTVKLDRLFRNAAEALKYSETWRKRKIALHSIHEGLQGDGAASRCFIAFSPCSPSLNAIKLRKGHGLGFLNVQLRGLNWVESLKYGFEADKDGRLFENKSEQGIIKLIVELRNEGMSHRKIAAELNRRGLLNRSGNSWNHVVVGKI